MLGSDLINLDKMKWYDKLWFLALIIVGTLAVTIYQIITFPFTYIYKKIKDH